MVLVILGYAWWTGSTSRKDTSKCQTCPQNIVTLTRQCARWLTAAVQDNNPLIALLHCQYGIGYLHAITDIASPLEFENATKLNFDQFKAEAMKIQDDINRRAAAACPNLVEGLPPYFGKIGGEIN